MGARAPSRRGEGNHRATEGDFVEEELCLAAASCEPWGFGSGTWRAEAGVCLMQCPPFPSLGDKAGGQLGG